MVNKIMQLEIMHLVEEICNMKSTNCRSLNKSNLARELMDFADIPQNAEIQEIPLDWNNQVVILFFMPNDKNYYSLFAGIGNDNKFHFDLTITGILKYNYFDSFENEIPLEADYFQKYKERNGIMKTFRITYEDYGIFKKDYVTAETESDALQIAKRIFFPDTSEGFADVYVKLGHIRAEEIKKPEKKSAYYVTIYNEYPIYEPAEGGYYYTGADISESWGFQTFRDAKRFIRKLYKECVQSGDTKSEYWYCNSNHLFFGMDSYYIGEGWFVQLERKQGKSVKGWEPYC